MGRDQSIPSYYDCYCNPGYLQFCYVLKDLMRFEVGCGDEESSLLGVSVGYTKPVSCVHVEFTTHKTLVLVCDIAGMLFQI